MTADPALIAAVEALDYRVTVGDVAARAGLEIETAQRDLIALAADTSAHLQVSEAGEIAYEFPKNLRGVLRNKYWQLRLQDTWNRIWPTLFYLVRISFGILLLISILIIVAAIIVIVIAANSSQREEDNRSNRGGGGGLIFIPRFWIGDLFWFFDYGAGDRPRRSRRSSQDNGDDMNFLEAVFSFLFGEGNPNGDLEETRWRTIGTVIQNHGGAIAAEQVAPYLDDLGSSVAIEGEDYMLPVLTRFNGIPQVSPEGNLIYHFPDLQVTTQESRPRPVSAYLKEQPWRFSAASPGKLALAAGLGVFNFGAAIVLGLLLQDPAVRTELGGFVTFVASIYGILLAYGTAFLAVPAGRYLWIRRQNQRIGDRNEQRQERASNLLVPGPALQEKLAYARQFMARQVVSKGNLAYTTETDLIDQEIAQKDKLDQEWLERLEGSGS